MAHHPSIAPQILLSPRAGRRPPFALTMPAIPHIRKTSSRFFVGFFPMSSMGRTGRTSTNFFGTIKKSSRCARTVALPHFPLALSSKLQPSTYHHRLGTRLPPKIGAGTPTTACNELLYSPVQFGAAHPQSPFGALFWPFALIECRSTTYE